LVGRISSSTIANCYSIGKVIGTTLRVGGLVGWDTSNTSWGSFWDMEASGLTWSDGGTGKTTVEMKNIATYTDLTIYGVGIAWDFVGNPFDDTEDEDIWDIDSTTLNGYPFLTSISLPVGNGEDVSSVQLSTITLKQNFPNPFNPTTTISFSIPLNSKAELAIYNIEGQKVKSLVNTYLYKGEHSFTWNGNDETGKSVGSGMYFYKLKTSESTLTRKMLLLK